ncbi:MAG: LamG-like jellyroll fold domain-containing protein [Verrucomicrobiota bacterium]
MKRTTFFAAALTALASALIVFFRPHESKVGGASPSMRAEAKPASKGARGTTRPTSSNAARELKSPAADNGAAGVKRPTSASEFDLKTNPYAGALRAPGKSKREWDAGFLTQFQGAADGTPIRFELTQGRQAAGVIRIVQKNELGELTYFSGELNEPEAGKFFFLKPPEGGKAGKAVGIIEFPASKTAYRVEPTGANGAPELWERQLDEVVCLNMAPPVHVDGATNEVQEATPLRPDGESLYVPAYNTNRNGAGIVSLQSNPGSRAVLLLDFFGGTTTTWGGVSYLPPAAANNVTIRDLWKRVSEDFMGFNINVTTDINVFKAASASGRQRCCFTDTPITAAGVAYIGSWNFGNDTVCWSVYTTGKDGAEVGAHEPGHTLGLGHDTQDVPSRGTTNHNEYFAGQGSGDTGWAPIMGVGYYKPVATWSKGEYQYAGNAQDDLNVIVTANNGVTYRSDDTGATLSGSRFLEVYPDASVFAEGVIERTADTDAFQFTTTGGKIALFALPVNDWANLAVNVTLADATDTIIASNEPGTTVSAGLETNIAQGTYTFRVTGAGRNNPLLNGFSDYASLGYFSIVGSVEGARAPTRFEVMEHSTNGTVVGTIPATDTNSSLLYTIVSGNSNNTFSVDNAGVLSVANNAQLDYQKLATNRSYAVQFELFVTISNVDSPELTEVNRRVVVSILNSAVNQPISVNGFNAGVIAPYNATPASPGATGFDIPNGWSFYQAGLCGNDQVTGTGGYQGLPTSGIINSLLDGSRFKLGPFGGTNALMLNTPYARFGALSFTSPQPYRSLSVLASSANGGVTGTLQITFTNGSKSSVLNFNAQDWYNTTANVGSQGFGRVRIGQPTFSTDNAGWNNPNLYQTTINLAALGYNQSIASISFTNPGTGGGQTAGIFAVSGTPMPPEASIVVQPVSVTNTVPSQGATFSTVAIGTGPLSYQWFFSASGSAGSFAALNGEMNSSLILPPVLQTNRAGSYFVVVTNDFGASTSSIGRLTIFREPVIVRQPAPTSISLFAGKSFALSAGATGASPLTYFYNFQGTPISSTTSSNYILGNLQASNSGIYSITVSNAFGAVTSSDVVITVSPRATNYAYTERIITDNAVSFWRLNETSGSLAHDYVGGKNGLFNNVGLNRAGYNASDPDRAVMFGPSINSYAGNIPIDFATLGNATFTAEAWVKAGAQTTDAGIISKGTGAGGEQFDLDTGGGNHAFRFFVRDASGTARSASGSIVPNGTWQHLVAVCNQANGYIALYVNGISNASGTITTNYGLLASTNPMTIGSRQSGASGSYNNQFNGLIDEVAIYNYALSPAQVQAHYSVRTNTAPAFGSNPISRPDATVGSSYASTLSGSATDPNGDAISYTKLTGPGWLTVANNGALSGIPASSDAGMNVFQVRAVDSTGLTTSAALQINVIALPVSASATLLDGTLQLSWTGGVSPYQVQMTTNLTNPDWQNVGTPTSDTSATFSVTNEAAFYRIVTP